MPRFSYIAVDPSGLKQRGSLDAPDSQAAYQQLISKNMTPVRVSTGDLSTPWWKRDVSLSGNSFTLEAQSAFFTLLAQLLSSKLSLRQSLEFCANHLDNEKSKAFARTLFDGISEGKTVKHSLEQSGTVLGADITSLLISGEQANTLEKSITSISSLLNARIEQRQQLRTALIYPSILMLMSLAVLAMVIYFLVPTLLPVFGSIGAKTPGFITTMDRLRLFLNEFGFYLLLVFSALVLVSVVSPKFRAVFSNNLLDRLPILGQYRRNAFHAELFASLQNLIESGYSLNQAVQTLSGGQGPFNKSAPILIEIGRHLSEGKSVHEAISNIPKADKAALSHIQIGEEANDLESGFGRAAILLNNRNKQTLKYAMTVLTPALTLLIGLFVGAIIFATISAILDLNDAVL